MPCSGTAILRVELALVTEVPQGPAGVRSAATGGENVLLGPTARGRCRAARRVPVFGRVGRHVTACAAIVGQLVPVAWIRAAAHRRAVSALGR